MSAATPRGEPDRRDAVPWVIVVGYETAGDRHVAADVEREATAA